MRNLEELNSRYEGQSAFIIAAGVSVAFQDLNPLKEHITFAVNSGLLAIEDPTFFVSDDWSVARWSYFINDLKDKSTTVCLYDKMFRYNKNLFGSRTVSFKHRTGYHITDFYSHSSYDAHICQARTSAGSAIHIAHIMGCSPIVLLGVDCCRHEGRRYFWQSPGYKKPSRIDGHSADRYKKCRKNGRQSDTDLVDILNYWEDKGKEMQKKCIIYNASPYSVLKVFPKVRLQDVV